MSIKIPGILSVKDDHDTRDEIAKRPVITNNVTICRTDRAIIISFLWPLVKGSANEWMVKVLAKGSE